MPRALLLFSLLLPLLLSLPQSTLASSTSLDSTHPLDGGDEADATRVRNTDATFAPPPDEEGEEEEEDTEAPDAFPEGEEDGPEPYSVEDELIHDWDPTQDPNLPGTTQGEPGYDPTRDPAATGTRSTREPGASKAAFPTSAAGRVNLTRCLEEESLCYMGKHCGNTSAWPESWKKYDYIELEPEDKEGLRSSPKNFLLMDRCDATALLRLTETDGVYEFEYHLGLARANLTLRMSKKRKFFLEKGELKCKRSCALEPLEISEIDGLFYWRGYMIMTKWRNKAATTARPRDRIQGYGRILDKESLAPEAVEGSDEEEEVEEKDEKDKEDKEENSYMTTILFSVLGCIVAAVFIAVVVCMVNQRRQAARAAQKQERLQRAAVSAAARVNRRRKPEAAPLLPPSQSGPASDSIENEGEGSVSARDVPNR